MCFDRAFRFAFRARFECVFVSYILMFCDVVVMCCVVMMLMLMMCVLSVVRCVNCVIVCDVFEWLIFVCF